MTSEKNITHPVEHLGDSVKLLDKLTLGSPMGLIQIWEHQYSDRRGRFFVSLNWKVTKPTKQAWILEMDNLWKSEAIQHSKTLLKTIKDLHEKLENAQRSIHPYKGEVISKIQGKINNIRNRYSEIF